MSQQQTQSNRAVSTSSFLKSWGLLLLLSLIGSGFLLLMHMSAGLLLGPMIAAIYVASKEKSCHLDRRYFHLAQSVLGLMIADSLTGDAIHEILAQWPLVLFSVTSVILASLAMGTWLAYNRIIPGTTALWGASPGGASTMVAMCGDFGADPRLAAFMLYSRVVMVAILTSLVAWWVAPDAHHHRDMVRLIMGNHLIADILLIFVCGLLLPLLRLPAVAMLGTLVISFGVKMAGFDIFDAPKILCVPAYFIIGWTVGLRFTKHVIAHVIKAFPAVIASSACVVGVCALLAFPISKWGHIDLLSAYLAASPGGLDTIIIISDGLPNKSQALPFIISLQTARMIAVLVIGPILARPLGRWLETHLHKKEHKHK